MGLELNPRTPFLFRREVTALTLIGSHELWADMRASYDDGDWVAVCSRTSRATHPDLDDDGTMDLLLRETERLGQVLAERVPDPPAPDPENGGLSDLRAMFHDWADAVARAGEVPPELLPDWIRRDTVTWEPLVRGLADHDVRLVHWDIRNDNLLQRPTGELVFLDWGAAGVGPGWLDPLLARLERVEDPWFDARPRLLPGARGGGRPGGGRLARGLRGLPRLAGAPRGRREPADPQRFPDQRVAAHAGGGRTTPGHRLTWPDLAIWARRSRARSGIVADRVCARLGAPALRLSNRSRTDRTKACPVANIKSQIKRIKQNEKRHQRNKAVKSDLKTAVRKFREAAESGEKDQAVELARNAGRKLDKAVSKGVIHKNQAANRKSAIAKKAASL